MDCLAAKYIQTAPASYFSASELRTRSAQASHLCAIMIIHKALACAYAQSLTGSWDMAACPAWLDFATNKCPAWLGGDVTGEGCEQPTQEEVNAICAEWSGLQIGVDQLETAGYDTPCLQATAAGPGEVFWAMFCGGRLPGFALSSGDCLAWGYSSERCGEMDCSNWGSYFDVITSNPTDYGFKGLWTSAAWIDTPHDLDAVRMSAGCSVEVALEVGGGGQTYTFNSDVRLCGNDVGCDRIRSIRVFKQGWLVVMRACLASLSPMPDFALARAFGSASMLV